MSIEARKIAFVQKFLRVESEETITNLEILLHSEKENEHFKPMTMEEYEARIDEALEDSIHGRLIKDSDLEKEIERWT